MKRNIIMISLFIILLSNSRLSMAQDFNDIAIHGFISQGYLKSSANDYMAKTEDGTFQYNEMGINFTLLLTHQLRIGTQFFARDLGLYGNDEIVMDWAYAEYRVNNPFGIRVGKFKVAHGLYNEVRDVDAVRTSVLLPRSVYLEPMRDVFVGMKGIGIFGRLPGDISYSASYGIMDMKKESDIAYVIYTLFTNGIKAEGIDVSGTIEDLDIEYLMNFGLQWETPLDGLKISTTAYGTELIEMIDYGFIAEATFKPMVYTLSSEYMLYNTIIVLEGMLIKVDFKLNIPSLDILEKDSQDIAGGYISVSQRLTDYLELGIYYSIFYEDLDDKEGDIYELIGEKNHIAWEKDACVSLRFDININWILKAETHFINGTNMIDNRIRTGDLKEDFWLFAFKVSYSF